MHRLAVFQHQIVGDVHDIVDRTYSQSAEAFPHPTGRGLYPDVFDNTGTVNGAQLGSLDFYIQHALAGTVTGFYFGGVELQRLFKGSGGLSCQTDDREAVGTVGGDLKLHAGVVEADGFTDGLAQSQIAAVLFGQDENAVFYRRGEIMSGETQLSQRAQHTILGAGHDLDIFIGASIYLADPQVVRIGVTLHGFHSGNHHIADLAAFNFIAFHLGTAHGHGFREGAHGHVVQGDKFFQPFHRKIHLSFTKPFLECI